MARKSLFTARDLLPSKIKISPITATTSLDGLIRFSIKLKGGTDLEPRFRAAINRASLRISVELKAALDSALRSGVWSTPEGIADIYETGELLQSGSVTLGANGIEISYDAPYASLVHFGGYIHPYGNARAKVYLPPRPWVEAVLRGGGPVPVFDFGQYYLEELRAEFSR